METKTETRKFLAQAPITRNGETFLAKAYPPPPDAQGSPRYVVEDPNGKEVKLELEEKMEFDRLIFRKPEPEDTYKLSSLQSNTLRKAKKKSA